MSRRLVLAGQLNRNLCVLALLELLADSESQGLQMREEQQNVKLTLGATQMKLYFLVPEVERMSSAQREREKERKMEGNDSIHLCK